MYTSTVCIVFNTMMSTKGIRMKDSAPGAECSRGDWYAITIQCNECKERSWIDSR